MTVHRSFDMTDINHNHFYHTSKYQVLAEAGYYFRPSKPHSGTQCGPIVLLVCLSVCVVSNWSFKWLTSGVFSNFEFSPRHWVENQLGCRLLKGHNNQYLRDFPQNLVIFRCRPDWRPEKLPADRLECIASQTRTSGKYPILRYASKPAINKWINLI